MTSLGEFTGSTGTSNFLDYTIKISFTGIPNSNEE